MSVRRGGWLSKRRRSGEQQQGMQLWACHCACHRCRCIRRGTPCLLSLLVGHLPCPLCCSKKRQEELQRFEKMREQQAEQAVWVAQVRCSSLQLAAWGVGFRQQSA